MTHSAEHIGAGDVTGQSSEDAGMKNDELRAFADRLDVLAHAVTECRWSEFSMRVPAKPDRDADCVLSSAAIELRAYAEAAKRVEMMEEALFQISVRLDAPREADMDEGDWHTDMISSAQYLANQAKRLAALEQAVGGAGPGR